MNSKITHQASMHRHVFTVTTPTQELNSIEYIEELIQPYTNYQVIPSPLIINYQADQIIAAALPTTKNKLVDITLPFILADPIGNEINYFGRYLLYNQRLIGIKLCSSIKEEVYANGDFKKWRSGTKTKYKVPNIITSYYRNSRFEEGTFANQIMVGDFMLILGDTKICLLFESQIQESQSTLFQYKKHGCQIFSIVCDIPKQANFQSNLNITNAKLNTKNENLLKRFARQNNRLLMYAGVRMATTRSLFLSNSFIVHPSLPQQSIQPFFFNDAITLSVVCESNFINKIDMNGTRREKVNKSKLYLQEQYCFVSLVQAPPGSVSKAYINGKRQVNVFSRDHGNLLKKMKLWFIFNSDNRKTPFIIPFPLSEKMTEVVQELQKLSDFLELPNQNFIAFYNKNKQDVQVQRYQGVEIYRDIDQLCSKCRYEKLNIYTDDRQHYEYLQTKAQYNSRLRIYFNYINFRNEKQARQNTLKSGKLSDFANHIVRSNITGYHKLLTQARNQVWKLNKHEQIEAITVFLVNKLRTEVNNHPFYKNLLNKSKDQIEQALAQAEINLINPSNLNLAIDNRIQSSSRLDEEVSIKSDEIQKQKQFLNKMKQLKKTQHKQKKKIQLVCHSCKLIFDKSCFYRCGTCRTETCYLCASQINLKSQIKSKKQIMDSLRCIVCKKICDCFECQNKTKKTEISFDFSISLKTNEISVPSLTLQQRNKKAMDQYRQACTICLINGRRGGRIKVACSTCDRQVCLTCIRDQQGGAHARFDSSWKCSVCKPPPPQIPFPELMAHSRQEKDQKKDNQVEPRQASVSQSHSYSPSKNQSNFKGNQNYQSRPFYNKNNNNNNNRPYNNNRNNNYSGNNDRGNSKMIDQNEEKKSNRSLSRSVSPPKNRNKPQRKESVSCSNSPKRGNNLNKNISKDSSNRNSSPQSAKNNKDTKKNNDKRKESRSVSVSHSPPRAANKKPSNKNSDRNPSNSATPPRKTNQRKRSNSGSGSRTPPKENKKKRSVSRSKSGSKKSRSRSRSRSRQRKNRDNSSNNSRKNEEKPQKLWNKQKNWGNNNNNNNSNERFGNNRGGRGGYRGRGGFDRNQGNNDRNQGGYDRNQGNYDRNQGNYDRNQRNDNNGYNKRGGYNNGYNNNNRRDNRDNSRNQEQNNENNQILSITNNYQSNNDVDY